MPYPISPFPTDFDPRILCQLEKCDENSTVNEEIQNRFLEKTLKWLCQSPTTTTIRVNTLKTDRNHLKTLIENHFNTLSTQIRPKIEFHSQLEDVLLIKHSEKSTQLEIYSNEVIVDSICGAAILRGAHIYAPGVMGMFSSARINDKVSIYVDLENKCKKGFAKTFDGPKLHVANGTIQMDRQMLFSPNGMASGTAIEVSENISNCPPLGDHYLPEGLALLQNLTSTICVYCLDPQPNEIILDMCASPGNKTTHIAARMKNAGKLFAADKTPGKVAELKRKCDDFGVLVDIIQADMTNVRNTPFSAQYFDRILLDAPCSALGKRPQIVNNTKNKVIRSYVPLQKRLFRSAVELLKPNGTLVYSTCTITLAENEGIVAWALNAFANIELVDCEPMYGSAGLGGTNLSDKQLKQVQRFGAEQCDGVGFFIAKFRKTY